MDADKGASNGTTVGIGPDPDARVRAAYDADPEREWGRLESGTQFRLERIVTWHALERHLPPAAAAPRVLDAGGGPGRYALELAGRGYRVTLLDLSPANLALARRRLGEAPSEVAARVEAIVEGSITDLSRFPDGSFEAVLCLGGPLSHVVDEAERRRAVAELRRVAAPGAPLLVSAMNRFGGYRTVVQWTDSWSLVFPHMLRSGHTTLASGAPAYAFLPEELVGLLEDAGLTIERLYGCSGLGAHLHEERLAALLDDPERWPLWRGVLLATCDHPNVVGVSNLLLAAASRRRRPGAVGDLNQVGLRSQPERDRRSAQWRHLASGPCRRVELAAEASLRRHRS
jgi:SAM-dependent methyltransferase